MKRQRIFSAFFVFNLFVSHCLFTLTVMQKKFVVILTLAAGFVSCNNNETLFRLLPSSQTNIEFNNTIIESDSINVLDFENVYNGGGVGFGDFNNDGLQDIYFTGNMVPNKLYVNKGNLEFEDVTEKAGVAGNGRWCRGVSVVDINNDGLLDMYVSASVKKNPGERQNLLYINQGPDENKIPHFTEAAAAYGLNDTTHTTMAAFFDYDNDGDLDVYLCVNHIIQGDYPNRFRPRLTKGEHPSTGRLYRNDWNDSLKHPVFTNVSQQAGILTEGYGHAVVISDINNDGWKDIYVTNDYLSQNILYINNKNGTFTDRVAEVFKHTSANAMGCDIIDINNDGLSDVIELDMNPEDNYRKKMMLNANSYQTYQNSDYLGYQYQYVRNTLQLNRGTAPKEKDSLGLPAFSEIAFFAGVAETDWSWTPLVTDFDNDGHRDLIVTNGFPRDVTDHDFVAFRKEAFAVTSTAQILEQIPEVKIHNYAYRNNGNLGFQNQTKEWGLLTPSFSNGAASADLDNDGDMDFVVNNINDKAMVYENGLMGNDKLKAKNYLRVSLRGDSLNRNGLGAWIKLYYNNKVQAYEQTPYRGYLSSAPMMAHFGLNDVASVDSVVVNWPNGMLQVITNIKPNQVLQVDIKNAKPADMRARFVHTQFDRLLTNISAASGIDYVQKEKDYVDFNIQKLLPHKFSEAGPALAVADLDGNKLDDIIAGGSYGNSAAVFLQQPDGRFITRELIPGASEFNKQWEDAGIVLFDADGDKDIDVFVTSGGYENSPYSDHYSDKLYVNDGKANFSIDTSGLPKNYTSKSCVRAADFDKDGDLDLFLGGRVEPWNYPKPVTSYIYRNDSQNGKLAFTDITSSVAPFLQKIGMITDAVWSDFDSDGWTDLVLTGEWMPISFIRNEKGIFKNVTGTSGISQETGWWRSVLPADFDNDGDIDYVAANLGLNSFYRASADFPVKIYAKDFDNNGSYDAVPSLFLPSTLENTERKEYPAQTRDDMVKQMIGFRAKFQNYKLYALATIDKMFSPDELKGAQVLQAINLSHCLVRNNGNGKFELIPLPTEAQFSCINGMIAEDLDADGNLDLIVNGNDYGTEVSVGRYDACNGIVFRGDGKGGFIPLSIHESGWYIPGNGRALVKLSGKNQLVWMAASENRGPLRLFEVKRGFKPITLDANDDHVVLTTKEGKQQRREIGYGASYLSQSARTIHLDSSAYKSVEIINTKGQKRKIQL